MLAAADAYGCGRYVPPAPIEAVGGMGALEPGVQVEHVNDALQRRASHPLASYREAVPASVAEPVDVPRGFISCTDKPEGDLLLALASGLRASGWDVQDLPTGHFAMLTMPDGLVDCLVAR